MRYLTATAPKYPLLARGVEAYNRGVERLGATPSLWSALGLGDSGPIPAANVSGKDVVGLLDFLGAPALSKTAERIAYGEPLTTGKGQTLRMLPETEEAVLMAAPAVAKAPSVAAKALEPVANKAVQAITRTPGATYMDAINAMEGMKGPMNPMVVWQGSPYKFDKLDSSKIGTGEGAQAYGYGLYFAESPDTAKWYATNLPTETKLRGKRMFDSNGEVQESTGDYVADYAMQEANGDPRLAAKLLLNENSVSRYNKENVKANQKAMAALRESRKDVQFQAPSLYKIDLPDEMVGKMLDYDKPIYRQSPEVRRAIRSVVEQEAGPGAYAEWIRNRPDFRDLRTNMLENATDAQVSELLKSRGIPGVRYFDGGSRGSGAGTSNFVVFPGLEEQLKILERTDVPVGLLND